MGCYLEQRCQLLCADASVVSLRAVGSLEVAVEDMQGALHRTDTRVDTSLGGTRIQAELSHPQK
jgi:hypothetical protein